jgi:hypothetical protein
VEVGEDFLDTIEKFVKITDWVRALFKKSVSVLLLPLLPYPSCYPGVNRATSAFKGFAVNSLKYTTVLKPYNNFKLNIPVHIKELIIKRRR